MNVVNKVLGRSAAANSLARSSARHVRRVVPRRTVVSYSTASTSTSTGNQFNQLIENLWFSKDLASIHKSCSALAAQVTKINVAPHTIPSDSSHHRIRTTIRTLAESGQDEDMKCIMQLLQDVYPTFGLTPTAKDYSFILQHLLSQGHDRQAFNLLMEMEKLPGGLTPTLEQFHAFLGPCGEISTFEFLLQSVAALQDMGLTPSNTTFIILLQARWTAAAREGKIPDIDELSTLVRWCVERGMSSDPVISSLLYQGYADVNEELAKDIVSVYDLATRPVEDLTHVQISSDAAPTESAPAATDRARYMLRDSTSYADIVNVSKSLNLTCDADHYAIVITNCVESGKYQQALVLYEKSVEAGVTPTAVMVAPLLQALYVGRLGTSDQEVDTALEIYKHLAEAWPPLSDDTPTQTEDEPSRGPTSAIYRILVRLALSSSDTTKYTPIAQSLLFDMELRGLTSDASFLAANKIVLELRRVGSFSKATDFYRKHRGKMDEKGYIAILKEYCRISFAGDLEVPLITEYFSIVNHMRLQRVPVTPLVYTIILNDIGVIATKIRRTAIHGSVAHTMHERLVDTTRRIHNFLTLDASISPDAALWNQLMNTYQRLSLFGDAQKLWQMMYLTGRYDHTTVNIMLDACGYSGQLRVARALIAKLGKAGYRLDLHNWDTWVEALCRNEHFDEAVDVITIEMPKNRTRPHAETVKIFRKFARKHGCWADYWPILESAVPDLWKYVPQEIKT